MPDLTPSPTIVVVTHNSRAHFRALKAALEQQTLAHDLIVIDSGSRAEERPLAADFPAATIFQLEENLGFAAANNRAVQRVAGPYVALLNPDAFPEPDWLMQMIAASERRPETACVASLLLMANDDRRYDGVGDCLHACGASWRGARGALRHETPREGYVFSACAAAALYRVDPWRALGGFDESYFCYGEDVDFGFRLRLAGWETVLAPAAVARHVGGGASRAGVDFETYHSVRNGCWTFYKNMPAPLLIALTPLQILWTLYVLWSALLRGRAGPAVRGLRDALAGLAAVFAARRTLQRTRRASWLDVARALTWSPLAIMRKTAKIRGQR